MPKIKVRVLPIAARKPENERNNPVNATNKGWVRTPLNKDAPEMLTEARGLVALLAECNLQPDGVTKIDPSKPIGKEIEMDVYDPNAILVTGVDIIAPTAPIKVGDTVQFDYDILPANASYPDVDWTVNDATVLQDLGEGSFKALKVGAFTITVIAVDGDKTDTYSGTVVAAS